MKTADHWMGLPTDFTARYSDVIGALIQNGFIVDVMNLVMHKLYPIFVGATILAAIATALWTVSNADASGANRFVVYESESGDIFMRRSTDNGNTWKTPVNLSSNPGKSYNPLLLVSGTNVYVTWTQDGTDGTDVYFRKSINNGGTWGPKVKISDSGAIWETSSFGMAASGTNVYLAWVDTGRTADVQEVFFRASLNNGGTWGSTQQLTVSDASSNNISITASGNSVFVLWQEDGSELLIKKSTNNGSTWSQKTIADGCSPLICDGQVSQVGL